MAIGFCQSVNNLANVSGFSRRQDRTLDELSRICLGYSCPKLVFDGSRQRVMSLNWSRTLSRVQIETWGRTARAYVLIFLSCQKPLENNSTLSESSPGTPDVQIGKYWTRVLLDGLHAMMRVTEHIPISHVYRRDFVSRLRDAIYIVNEDDRKMVEEVLSKRNPPTVFDKVLAQSPEWIWSRIRRVIPPPNELARRLQNLQEEFSRPLYINAQGVPVLSDRSAGAEKSYRPR